MINESISALLQILIFTALPFLVYVIQKRTSKGFFEYIGLKKSTARANGLAALASLIFVSGALGLALVSEEMRETLLHPDTMTGKFRQMGFGPEAVLILLLAALFKTSLSEEILFRGFLAKRLMYGRLGMFWGNVVQALLFGILHVGLFLALGSGLGYLVFIFLLTTLGAYISAYLNEHLANGSIIPGWIAHGLGNVISYSVIGFLI